jgi:hypothetical protein
MLTAVPVASCDTRKKHWPQRRRDGRGLSASSHTCLLAPYKHPRLGAIRVAGDVNKQIGLGDDASLEELRAAVMTRLERLAPVLGLQAFMAPADGIADRDVQ